MPAAVAAARARAEARRAARRPTAARQVWIRLAPLSNLAQNQAPIPGSTPSSPAVNPANGNLFYTIGVVGAGPYDPPSVFTYNAVSQRPDDRFWLRAWPGSTTAYLIVQRSFLPTDLGRRFRTWNYTA